MADTQDRAQQPTEQELRDLGSAEASAWTITSPGGQPVSLDEHVAAQNARTQQEEAGLQALKEEMELEAQRRAQKS